MRLCSPWQRCGLPGAGPIKGFCSGWRAHCRKIVPRKISMVHWRKRNARQMTAAGPRRGPESGVVQAPAPGHPSLLGTPCSGPAVGPRVASGAGRAQGNRDKRRVPLRLGLVACLPSASGHPPRRQVWGPVVFQGPWGRVRLRGAAGLERGVAGVRGGKERQKGSA